MWDEGREGRDSNEVREGKSEGRVSYIRSEVKEK